MTTAAHPEHGIPILLAVRMPSDDPIKDLRIWCKYCKKYHYHSPECGHRVAHCEDPRWPKKHSPYKESGYIICVMPNIYDVVSKDVSLTKQGKNYFGICPFHAETKASFSVNKQKQFFFCFGCGKGGDVIDYIEFMHSCDLREALDLMRKDGFEVSDLLYSDLDQRMRSVSGQA